VSFPGLKKPDDKFPLSPISNVFVYSVRQLFKGDQLTPVSLKGLRESVSKVTYDHAKIFLLKWLDSSTTLSSILQKPQPSTPTLLLLDLIAFYDREVGGFELTQ